MRNIQKMIADRTKKLNEMRSLTDAVEKRDSKKMTDAENTSFKTLSGEVDSLATEIREETETQARELAAARTPAGTPGAYGSGVGFAMQTPAVGRDYRSLFHKDACGGSLGNGDFKDADEFFRVVASGRWDARIDALNEKRQQMTGIGHLGGFTCPEGMAETIMDRALDAEIIRSRAQPWPMTTQTQQIPCWNTQNTTSNIGGLQGVWLNELGASTTQDALLREITLKLKKLGIYCAASREVMNFGTNFGQNLMMIMAQAIAYYQDLAFFRGTGAGQPVGVIDAACTIAVPRQAAGSINFDDVVNLLARLLPGSFSNAIWVASQTALPALMSVASRIGVGTGGSYVPLVAQSGNTFTMLGFPLLFTEKVPALGARGDIGIYDFSKYAVGMHRDVILETSNAPGWLTDRTDFRSILLVDGQPLFSQPLVQREGNTVSPFVVLDNDTTTTTAP